MAVGTSGSLDLEQARRQAKELLRAARAGDAAARGRIAAHAGRAEPVLADAQHALARELGFTGWASLKLAVEDAAATEAERRDRLVRDATHRRLDRARGRLEAEPALGAGDAWAALVLGDEEAVARVLRREPGFAQRAGGPNGWQPLLYVTHSAFLRTDRAAGLRGTASLLLAAGADPNASFPLPEYDSSASALYGAAGIAHDPELTRILLAAGASPDDGESLYHATEAVSPECLRLLLEHGAETRGTNALAHALDGGRIEHVRLLLDAGADPNAGALLAHAVRRGCDADVVRLLVEGGADLDRPGGETWRGAVPLRTPYQHAVLRGRTELAQLLAGLGASTALDPGDEAVAAIARGERPSTSLSAGLDPDAQEVLILQALRGRLALVVEAVGPSFSGVVGGSPPGTLLHHAAWVGDPAVVAELLRRGADPLALAEGQTPLAWAVGGSQWHTIPGRDYVAVAQLLAGHGAEPEAGMLDVAQGALLAWLEERLPDAP